MKLKQIQFNQHPNLGNLNLNLCDTHGNPLNTVVLIGPNASGKTTILKNIFESFDTSKLLALTPKNLAPTLSIEITENEEKQFDNNFYRHLKNKSIYPEFTSEQHHYFSKIIYMPTEINFSHLNQVKNTYKKEEQLLNIIDQQMTSDIPSLIATKMNSEIFKNRNLTIGQVIDKVCDEINHIFSILQLNVQLIGLSEDESSRPLFKNHLGQEFDINDLSSGEKQLFLRALSLKFLNVNHSIILIDEPEISLHPTWQSKIINVYENIGKNNQIIIATHSPHILSNIKAEQIRLINRTELGVISISGDDVNETYGHTIESILVETMGLAHIRNEEITQKIKKLQNDLQHGTYEIETFKKDLLNLKNYLGPHDSDLTLIELEFKRQNLKKVNPHVKHY